MQLKNTLIVVEDVERARRFYHDLFGLEMLTDNDGNMILTEGLVLQNRKKMGGVHSQVSHPGKQFL